jgi:hypothetical protein
VSRPTCRAPTVRSPERSLQRGHRVVVSFFSLLFVPLGRQPKSKLALLHKFGVYSQSWLTRFLMDAKTSTAAVFVMAAGLFYRGGTQNISNYSASTQTGGNTQLVSGASPSVESSAESGPWIPVCRYVAFEEKEVPRQSVNLAPKFYGSSGNKNLSMSSSREEQEGKPKDQFCLTSPGRPSWAGDFGNSAYCSELLKSVTGRAGAASSLRI